MSLLEYSVLNRAARNIGKNLIKPVLVKFKINDFCNANCVMCDYWKNTEENYIPLNTIRKSLTELSSLGTEVVIFSGGEPTIHPKFKEIIKEAKSLGLKVLLLSNGIALNSKLIDFLLRQGVDELQLSIDSFDKSVADAVRGGGVYNNILNVLKYINENRTGDFKISIESVLMKSNFREIDKIVNFNNYCEINSFHFQFIEFPKSRAYDYEKLALSPDELKHFRETVIPKCINTLNEKGYKKNEIERFLFPTMKEAEEYRTKTKCFVPSFRALVRFDGTVFPCCHCESACFGSINESSFDTIWNGKDANAFRKELQKNLFDCCANCSFVYTNKAINELISE